MSSLAIQKLRELVDNKVKADYVEHVWKKLNDWDVDKASNWLLDRKDDLESLEVEWREERKSRAAIASRFDLVEESNRPRRPTPNAPIEQRESKARYRDGQIVASKGEKYVFEQTREQWDGGSRGKVKTKGKRGKGFQ